MTARSVRARLDRLGGGAEARALAREIDALLDELAAFGPDAVAETLAALGFDPEYPKEEA